MTKFPCKDCGETPETKRRKVFTSRLDNQKYIARCGCGNGVSVIAKPFQGNGILRVVERWNNQYGAEPSFGV